MGFWGSDSTTKVEEYGVADAGEVIRGSGKSARDAARLLEKNARYAETGSLIVGDKARYTEAGSLQVGDKGKLTTGQDVSGAKAGRDLSVVEGVNFAGATGPITITSGMDATALTSLLNRATPTITAPGGTVTAELSAQAPAAPSFALEEWLRLLPFLLLAGVLAFFLWRKS